MRVLPRREEYHLRGSRQPGLHQGGRVRGEGRLREGDPVLRPLRDDGGYDKQVRYLHKCLENNNDNQSSRSSYHAVTQLIIIDIFISAYDDFVFTKNQRDNECNAVLIIQDKGFLPLD